MSTPTNPELFSLPEDRVLRLEFLPYPAVSYEEHFNTNALLDLQRFGLLIRDVLGPVKTNGYDVVVDGTDVKVKAGILFFQEFIVQEQQDVVVDAFVGEERNVILHVEKVQKTFSSHPQDVGVTQEGRSLSGPNQYTYEVNYLYTGGSAPANDANNFYLHLADIHADGTWTKRIPNREELLHELQEGEEILTTDNYQLLDTHLKSFFTERKVDFGDGEELALFIPAELAEIDLVSPSMQVERVESLTYAADTDPNFTPSSSLFQQGMGNRCRVEFSWGYKTTSAVGQGDVVTLDNSGVDTNSGNSFNFVENELVGLRLYFDGTFYRITANTATTTGETDVTIIGIDGSTPALSGETAGASNPAVIDNWASEYKIRARDYSGVISETLVTERISGSNSPVVQHAYLEMDIGVRYSVELFSYSALRSDFQKQTLPSGLFDQWGTETVNYDASPDFIPQFTDIPNLPSLALSQYEDNDYMMEIAISAPTESEDDFAEAYEVVWNVNDVGQDNPPQFNSGGYHGSAIIYNYPALRGETKREVVPHKVPSTNTKDIQLKYRALVGRQVVSEEGQVVVPMSLNDVSAPQTIETEFLPDGLYESSRSNDEFGRNNFNDRHHNPAAVRVTWDAVEKASSYQVETIFLDASDNPVKGTQKMYNAPLSAANNVGGDNGLVVDYQVGRKMRIKVYGINPDSTSGPASTVVFDHSPSRLQAPEFNRPTPDDMGVVVSWGSVDEADHYEVLWSLTGTPQVDNENAPSDQESQKTGNTKIRISARSGTDLYVAVISIDKYGRRSLNMARLQTRSGRIQGEPDLKTWSILEDNKDAVTAGDNRRVAVNRWNQPLHVMGVSVRALDGKYYEAGTTTQPSDGTLEDHPVKIRVYRQFEISNNVSVGAGALESENLIGTMNDYDQSPLLTDPIQNVLVVDFINEHSSYDLVDFEAEIFVYYKFAEDLGPEEEDRFRREVERFREPNRR